MNELLALALVVAALLALAVAGHYLSTSYLRRNIDRKEF